MAFLADIRLKAGLFFLRRQSRKVQRKKSIFDFRKVNTIALLYPLNEPAIPAEIGLLSKALKEEGKNVFHVVYFTGEIKNPDLPDTANRFVFTKKDIGLFFKPAGKIVDKFALVHAEYVIDLSFNDIFPLTYLAATSRANLRIGKHSEMRLPFFDFLINERTENRQEFINHLLHYLKILNPGKHE